MGIASHRGHRGGIGVAVKNFMVVSDPPAMVKEGKVNSFNVK